MATDFWRTFRSGRVERIWPTV